MVLRYCFLKKKYKLNKIRKNIKWTLLIIIGITLFNCKSDTKNKGNNVSKVIENKKELKFAIKNSSDYDLKDLTIGLPDTVLTYKNLEKHSQTELVRIESAYHYGFVRFYDTDNRKYYVQPIDYVGEKLYKNGEMIFIIEDVDRVKRNFELNSNYKSN